MIFDHIGVVCKDITQGKSFFTDIFEITQWGELISDPIQKVTVLFGWDAAGVCYELIAPNTDDAPIIQALKKRSNILNHVCYRVESLEVAEEKMRDKGCLPVTTPQPAVAFNGARIQFFYTPLDFIVELVEAVGFQKLRGTESIQPSST